MSIDKPGYLPQAAGVWCTIKSESEDSVKVPTCPVCGKSHTYVGIEAVPEIVRCQSVTNVRFVILKVF